MITIKISAAALLAMLSFFAIAQVKTDFSNKELISDRGRFNKSYKDQVDFEIPAKDIKKLIEKEKNEDKSRNGEERFRLAEPVVVDLDIARRINWKADSGYAFGIFNIKADGAFSTSINFDRFYLPEGTEMYIYNKNGSIITGPITESENNSSMTWGSWVYKGPYLTIEIKTPLLTKDQLLLHSNNIAYGYKEVYRTETGGFGQSANCEINVVCPLGTGWVEERNSVALVLNANGSDWCSGAMIMNTCNTNRPFFLTANHCYATSPVQNVAAWRFTFQAWSTTCPNPGTNSNGVTYNGSTLRANWGGTDFCLVELNNTPPANSGIRYAGWNRNTNGITQATIIHHPAGDVMKISRDVDPPVFDNFSNVQSWRLGLNLAGGLDQGATEGGTSGAPYFDQNHRVIGQHYGVNDGALPVCNRINKFGGRFDLSWAGGGTNATRLSNWLNPSNYNVFTTNTTNVSNLTNASPALSISGNSALCSSGSYTLNGATTGTISWTSSNTSIATVTQGNPATVTKVGNGSVNITATVTFCPNVTTAVTKTISVGVPNNYYIQSMSMNSSNRLDIYPSFTGYQMSVTSWAVYVDGSFSTSGSGYPPSVISVYASCGSHDVTLTTSNSCGSYSTSSYYSGSCYALTPNPASDDVTITDMSANTKSSSSGGKTLASIGSKVTITVFDITNRPMKQFTFSQRSRYNFSVADLTPGIYIVQIKQNGSVNSLKMMKE